MTVPGQNAPDLREEGSSSTGSDGFYSLVQLGHRSRVPFGRIGI